MSPFLLPNRALLFPNMNTTTQEYRDFIALNPCAEALAYISRYENLHDAWDNCNRPDWMFWYMNVTKRTTTLMQQETFEWIRSKPKDTISICLLKTYTQQFYYTDATFQEKAFTLGMLIVHMHNFPHLCNELCDFIRSNLISNPFAKHEHL